jgi:hypothetical protein
MNVPIVTDQSISVRLVTAHHGGVVTGADVFNLAHFGGVLPNVGDTFLWIRNEDDYDSKVVQRRYCVTQPDHSMHWTLPMRDAPPNPEFTGIVRNALAVSDYLRAAREGRPVKEVVALLRKCNEGWEL